jgi:chromosome segregation ATPase
VVEDHQRRIAAKRIAQRLAYPHYVSHPNTETGQEELHPDSLWCAVDVPDSRASGWVYQRLAHIRRVADIEEGDRLAGKGKVTITQEAYLQEPRGGRSVKRPDRDLVCGAAARAAQLKAVRARLADVNAQLRSKQRALAEAEAARKAALDRKALAEALLKLPDEREILAQYALELESATAAATAAKTAYEGLAAQEEEWERASNAYTRREQELVGQEKELRSKVQEVENRIAAATRGYNTTEAALNRFRAQTPALPELPPDVLADFQSQNLSADHYVNEVSKHETELAALALPEHEIPEDLYRREQEKLVYIQGQLTAMKERAEQQEDLYHRAQADFERHVVHLFDVLMSKHFRDYCKLASGRGSVQVMHDNEDHWALNVSVGYHGKTPEPLEVAPLSSGERIFTGLYMVLSALRAADAEPILVLDELFGTLSPGHALLTAQRLRETGVQTFIAAPDIHPNVLPAMDAVWRFYPKADDADYAPPVVIGAGAGA